MPALDAQMPSSTSACASTSTRRAAYGAPEAPVMPRKTRMGRLFRALGGVQELAELPQLVAPATAALLSWKPSRAAHVGTASTTSLASAPFAVAPLYVSTPIEI